MAGKCGRQPRTRSWSWKCMWWLKASTDDVGFCESADLRGQRKEFKGIVHPDINIRVISNLKFSLNSGAQNCKCSRVNYSFKMERVRDAVCITLGVIISVFSNSLWSTFLYLMWDKETIQLFAMMCSFQGQTPKHPAADWCIRDQERVLHHTRAVSLTSVCRDQSCSLPSVIQ